jgi:hypothetical protein
MSSHRRHHDRHFTRAAIAGLAAHLLFELAAGVGMPLASLVGPVPAASAWAIALPTTARAARTTTARADTFFAVLNGFGLAAVIAHMASWPHRRTAAGLPWLLDCEGLGPRLMRYYNPILYTSATMAGLAILTENRKAPRVATLIPLSLIPAIGYAQQAEFRRLKRHAATAPRRWNRRLQDPPAGD